jgi:hypothetical protein
MGARMPFALKVLLAWFDAIAAFGAMLWLFTSTVMWVKVTVCFAAAISLAAILGYFVGRWHERRLIHSRQPERVREPGLDGQVAAGRWTPFKQRIGIATRER